jgi:hypothetical protein
VVKCDIVTLFCTRSQFTAGMSVCGHTLQHAIFFASLEWRPAKRGLHTQSSWRGHREQVPCCDGSAQPGTGFHRVGQRVGEHLHRVQPVQDAQDTFALHSGRARSSEPNAACAGTDRRHVQMLLVSLKPHRVVLALNKRSLDFLSRSSASE